MPTDPKDLDPNTLPAGPVTNAMVAEEWMEWILGTSSYSSHYFTLDGHPTIYCKCRGCCDSYVTFIWSPSTNPAHAGEARRKGPEHVLKHGTGREGEPGCWFYFEGQSAWFCAYSEVTGDTEEEIKGRAEALATVRAIAAAAMKAKAERAGR